ncbi:MAG: ATP-binding protein [Pedobacter sp.]|uniref:ATP-binding protein n=1 Tax=Pedobacter sp. TaxID=1411316 RepID=UPI0033919D83
MNTEKSKEELLALLEEAEYLLEEANDTIHAIRSGQIDALIVKDDEGHSIFTLKTADHSFRIFIEQMSEGAVTLNQDGIILYANSSFSEITGLMLEKIIGQPFQRFIQDKDQLFWSRIMLNAWEHHTKLELKLFTADQNEVPVLLSLKRLELSEGLCMSIIITNLTVQQENQRLLQESNEQLLDAQRVANHLNATLELTVEERTKELTINIAEKELVEKELRTNQERLSRVLETMAEGVIIMDVEGKTTYANPMAKKMLGITGLNRTEYVYADWQMLWINGEPLPPQYYPITNAIETGNPVYDYEIAVQPIEGERFYISMNAAPLKDTDGEIIAGIGTFMDVTNRRKAIQQKDDFISVASHELRTPVTSLQASLQLMNKLRDRLDSPMLPKLILQANKSMDKMRALIDDLLNATNMTEGQLQLKKSWVVLRDLVDDCCHDIRSGGAFDIVVSCEPVVKVFADAHKIEQVLVNFISNAAKYAPDSKEINICITQEKDVTKVTVTDHGPGIPAAKIPYIFDRYYRVTSDGSQYSGLGLGLYICSQIIYKHDGDIGVESEIGKGSSFWFSLPTSPIA